MQWDAVVYVSTAICIYIITRKMLPLSEAIYIFALPINENTNRTLLFIIEFTVGERRICIMPGKFDKLVKKNLICHNIIILTRKNKDRYKNANKTKGYELHVSAFWVIFFNLSNCSSERNYDQCRISCVQSRLEFMRNFFNPNLLLVKNNFIDSKWFWY